MAYINSFQGAESTLIILDMVVSDQLSFTKSANRLNVTITKARDEIIIVANVKAIKTIRKGEA